MRRHVAYIPTIAAVLAAAALEPLWCIGHRWLQSSADREAKRFLEYHPNATIRSSR